MGAPECIPALGMPLPVGGKRAAAGFPTELLPVFGAGSMLRFPVPLLADVVGFD